MSSTTTAFCSPPVTAGSAVLAALRICFLLRLNLRLLPRPPRRSPALTAGGSPRPGRQRHLRAAEGREGGRHKVSFAGLRRRRRLPVLPGGERRSSGTGAGSGAAPVPSHPSGRPAEGKAAVRHQRLLTAMAPRLSRLTVRAPPPAGSGAEAGSARGSSRWRSSGRGGASPTPLPAHSRYLPSGRRRSAASSCPPRGCHCPPLPPPPPPRRLSAARRLARRRAAAIFGESWGGREGAVGSGAQCACAESSRAGGRGRRPEGWAGPWCVGVVCVWRGRGLLEGVAGGGARGSVGSVSVVPEP